MGGAGPGLGWCLPQVETGSRHWDLGSESWYLCRYNSLSILPAALGKPVREVAAKVCDSGARGGGVSWGFPWDWLCSPSGQGCWHPRELVW